MNSIETQLHQLVQHINPGGRLLRAWPLTGGVSAQVTALEVLLPSGQARNMIVRQHGEADRRQNPHIAADEFRLLHLLHTQGIPAPKPYYADPSGEIFSIPCLVVEYIEGESEFAPTDLSDFIRQFAAHLAQIHQVDVSAVDVSFLPDQTAAYRARLKNRPAVLDHSLEEGRIRDTLEAVWPLPQANPSVLLHGDYWPGNLLWRDGQLVGVVDWEDAATGDPLSDLANSRLEMLWSFGTDAMHDFTQQYQFLMPRLDFTNLPYWDLCAALRPASRLSEWAGSAAREEIMRERHRFFVARAYAALSLGFKGLSGN